MAITARVPLSARRFELRTFRIRVTGLDLTGVPLGMQVRLSADTPGAPLLNLATVTTASAEGLKLDSVVVEDGVPVSTIVGRINKATMSDGSGLGRVGEPGQPSRFDYALRFGDTTRLAGPFWALPSAYDSDTATPTGSYSGSADSPSEPTSQISVTIANEEIISLSIDGVDALAPLVALAKTEADRAESEANRLDALYEQSVQKIAEQGIALGNLRVDVTELQPKYRTVDEVLRIAAQANSVLRADEPMTLVSVTGEGSVINIPANAEANYLPGTTYRIARPSGGPIDVTSHDGIGGPGFRHRLRLDAKRQTAEITYFPNIGWVVAGYDDQSNLTADLWVSSINGDDANDGTARNAAVTIAKAKTLLADGMSVRFECGSVFTGDNEFFDRPDLALHVDTYGDGPMPLLDCGDDISQNWSAGGQPNVWLQTVQIDDYDTELGGISALNVTANDWLLWRRNTVSEVAATPGSVMIVATGTTSRANSGLVDVYLHMPNSGVPANVKISQRPFAMNLGTGSSVRGIETNLHRYNHGSVVIENVGVVEFNYLRNGGKHNCYHGFGSTVRCNRFFEGQPQDTSGASLLVTYQAANGNLDTLIEGNMFRCQAPYAPPAIAYYGHSIAGAVPGKDITLRNNSYLDCVGGIHAGVEQISGMTYREYESAYFTPHPGGFRWDVPVCYYSGAGVTEKLCKTYFATPWPLNGQARAARLYALNGKYFIDGSEIFCGPLYLRILESHAGAPDFSVDNVLCHADSVFIEYGGPQPTIRSITGNKSNSAFPVVGRVPANLTGPITGNENPLAQVWVFGGVDRTFAQWKSLGFDPDYTGQDGKGDYRAAARPRTETPKPGIASLPNYVWIDPELSAITEAGGNIATVEGLDRAGRDFAALGSPKRVVVDGRYWFDPGSDGGLQYTLDKDVVVPALVAVLRPKVPLQAGSVMGWLATFLNDDSNRIALSGSGIGQDNIVTGVITNGQQSKVYADPAASWPANEPLVMSVWYRVATGKMVLRINGAEIAEFVSSGTAISPYLTTGTRGQKLTLMRDIAGNNVLQSLLGPFFFGDIAGEHLPAIEAQLMQDWGV